MRHAKSSWDDPFLTDMQRPLNNRGQLDAPRMGTALGARLVPMTFYVSPAVRAQQTFIAMQKNWAGLEKQHCVTAPALYTFDCREVLEWLSRQPSETERLALVGHNPAMTDCVNYFAGAGTMDNLPTAGWAELLIQIDEWSQVPVAQDGGELCCSLFPKELARAEKCYR